MWQIFIVLISTAFANKDANNIQGRGSLLQRQLMPFVGMNMQQMLYPFQRAGLSPFQGAGLSPLQGAGLSPFQGAGLSPFQGAGLPLSSFPLSGGLASSGGLNYPLAMSFSSGNLLNDRLSAIRGSRTMSNDFLGQPYFQGNPTSYGIPMQQVYNGINRSKDMLPYTQRYGMTNLRPDFMNYQNQRNNLNLFGINQHQNMLNGANSRINFGNQDMFRKGPLPLNPMIQNIASLNNPNRSGVNKNWLIDNSLLHNSLPQVPYNAGSSSPRIRFPSTSTLNSGSLAFLPNKNKGI